MKRYALGWACNLNDLFVRFPYEKCVTLCKIIKDKYARRRKIKQVFREGIKAVLNDVIENNASFKVPPLGYYGGEIHLERCEGEDFIKAKKLGKFKGIDFLETNFTAYQMNLYIHGKRDNFLHRRKFPIYINKEFRDKLKEQVNNGKQYC